MMDFARMGTYKQHGLLCMVWLILFCGGSARIVLLCSSPDSVLDRIGQSGVTTEIAGGDGFLEIKDAYQRVLARHHAGGNMNQETNAEQGKDIARIESIGFRSANLAGNDFDVAPCLPVGFPASDSLWIGAQTARAKVLLRRAVLDAGFQIDEKNLLTAFEKK